MTRTVILLATALALGGCGGFNRPYPDRNFYTLSAGDVGALPSATGETKVVRVTRARLAAPFGSRSFQYRVDEHRFEADYYERWADDPGALISAACVEALAASGRFQAVLDDGTSATATDTLELYVSAFYVDATTSPRHAVLVVQVTSLGPDGEVRLSRELQASTPVDSSAAADLVRAWNVSLESVLGELIMDLSG